MWSKIWSGVPTLAISGYFWLFYQIQKYFLKISYFLKSDCWWNTWIWRKSWEPRGCSCCKLCQQQFPPNLFSLKLSDNNGWKNTGNGNLKDFFNQAKAGLRPARPRIIKNLQYDFPIMRRGSRAVWNFSENSSDLVAGPFPKLSHAMTKIIISNVLLA